MLLVFISVFPVIVILLYIYFRDKYEKEPIGLLLKAFVGGLLSALATILFLSPLHRFFPEFYSVHGMAFFRAFAGAAIPEEILKFAFLYFIIWNKKTSMRTLMALFTRYLWRWVLLVSKMCSM